MTKQSGKTNEVHLKSWNHIQAGVQRTLKCVQAANLILGLRLGPVRPGAACSSAPNRGWLLLARFMEGTSCSINPSQVSALAAVLEMQSCDTHFCFHRSSLGWLSLSSRLDSSGGCAFVSRHLLGGQLSLVYSVSWSLP